MFKNKFFAIMATVILSAILFTACSEDDPITPTEWIPNPPTNIQATSMDDSSVLLKWEHSTDKDDTRFVGYKLDISPGTFQTINIAKTQEVPFKVDDLEEGTIYTFTLVSYSDEGEQSSSISIEWSPASRFVQNVNSEPIRIYETASAFGSGLDMFFEDVPGNPSGPRSLTVANSAHWDLGVHVAGNVVTFGSATQLSYNYSTQPQPTQIGLNAQKLYQVNSLDDIFDSQALTEAAPFQEYTTDLSQIPGTTGVAFVVRKYEPGETRYNYAKVLVKRGTTGQFLQGSAPNRYLELEISYQRTPDVPYAKIPEPGE